MVYLLYYILKVTTNIMAELKRTYYSSGELKSEVYIINGKKNGENKS